jgi:hypothetical protein
MHEEKATDVGGIDQSEVDDIRLASDVNSVIGELMFLKDGGDKSFFLRLCARTPARPHALLQWPREQFPHR